MLAEHKAQCVKDCYRVQQLSVHAPHIPQSLWVPELLLPLLRTAPALLRFCQVIQCSVCAFYLSSEGWGGSLCVVLFSGGSTAIDCCFRATLGGLAGGLV
mgnify:CR=1